METRRISEFLISVTGVPPGKAMGPVEVFGAPTLGVAPPPPRLRNPQSVAEYIWSNPSKW